MRPNLLRAPGYGIPPHMVEATRLALSFPSQIENFNWITSLEVCASLIKLLLPFTSDSILLITETSRASIIISCVYFTYRLLTFDETCMLIGLMCKSIMMRTTVDILWQRIFRKLFYSIVLQSFVRNGGKGNSAMVTRKHECKQPHTQDMGARRQWVGSKTSTVTLCPRKETPAPIH
jgi:hypothetical protein